MTLIRAKNARHYLLCLLFQADFYMYTTLDLLSVSSVMIFKHMFMQICEMYYTGCIRKNFPIWEVHSFAWGGRPVVGSASSNSGVRTVFIVHLGVVGRTSSFYCWGVNKKWRVAGSNTACIVLPPRSPDLTPCNFFSGATSKQRFTNNVPKLWKLWRRRYDRKLLPLHLKWFSSSRTATERGYVSVSIFKAATFVMFCSKHVDVKRHSVNFPEIKKTFAVSSLVLNLLASQIGNFFLPHPVYL